tara:strand:+ start:624 stop:1517 length:894 start_codon:yes stop_codon:yes gene_type:complete
VRVSLLRKILPDFLRVPVVILLRKTGISTWFQNQLYAHEASALKKNFTATLPSVSTSKMKVLIVCAHYNHTEFLPGCVSSILEQTHTNWHLIIADDASTDASTNAVLRDQSNRDTRIDGITLQENSGAYVARNTGVRASQKSDWTHVTFIDPDDVANPTWLQHSLDVLAGREGSVRPYIRRFDTALQKPLQAYFGHCPTLHSRFAWERAGGFLSLRRSGDSELTLRMSHLSKDGLTVNVKSFEESIKCRHIPGSATHQDLTSRKLMLENRDDELQKMSPSEMKINSPAITSFKKCSE